MNSIQKTARTAGFLYLLLIPLGVFGMLYIPKTLFVPGDVALTIRNILSNESLYRLSIVSALITQIVQIFVVLYLYKVLKPVNKNLAVLMVVFILVAVPMAMFNEIFQFAVLLLINGNDINILFTAKQIQSMVSVLLETHSHGIFIAQIFWGLWLFPMGYLVFKSNYIPKIIGVLLIIACFGYLTDSFVYFFIADFNVTFSEFTFLGELLITLWLIFKGVNVKQWEKLALESSYF